MMLIGLSACRLRCACVPTDVAVHVRDNDDDDEQGVCSDARKCCRRVVYGVEEQRAKGDWWLGNELSACRSVCYCQTGAGMPAS